MADDPGRRSGGPGLLGFLLPLLIAALCFGRGMWEGEPVTKPIEQIRLGERVAGINPLATAEERQSPEPDRSTWRLVRLRACKPDGQSLVIEILRPLTWLEANAVHPGSTLALDLVELSFRGEGRVVSIDSCPEIASGPGHVVTGRFIHSSAEVLDLWIEGSEEPIGTTGVHPFWSVDRQEFLAAAHLRIGERLRTSGGPPVAITNVTRRGPPAPVYNIEVHGEHVYRVGPVGILVHNQKLPDPPEVTMWRAPPHPTPPAQIADEMANGFDPGNYPGMGTFFGTDEAFVADKFQYNYQNGMQQFHMPQETFNDLVGSRVIQPDDFPGYPPGVSWHVPPDGLSQFNEGIFQGTPPQYIPNGDYIPPQYR